MKTKKIFAVIAVAVMLTGCGTILQTATVAVDIADKTYNAAGALSGRESKPDLIIGKELETHKIGEYLIKVSDGSFKKNPCIILMAYKNGRGVQSLSYFKKNPEDEKMINDFNQMDQVGKKQFIKERFLRVAKIDLGPIESEATEKTSVSAPLPLPNIPAPGFAPSPVKPR